MPVVAPGDRAPSFPLPTLGGGRREIPGSAPLTLLVFLKASCPTCQWVLPFVQALHERAVGLTVVGIFSDPPDEARSAAEEAAVGFAAAVESEPWEVSAAYGLSAVPTLVLVDGTGVVRLVSEGFSRDDFLEVAREAARAAGSEPADPFPPGEAVPVFRPG